MRRLLRAALLLIACGALAADFAPVLPGRALRFPADTGAHPQFRTEWWYVTGWLTDEDGAERGFQVTFFRVGSGLAADNPSRFAPRQLVLAHAAIADPAIGHLLHAERAARADDAAAGFSEERTRAWMRDWHIEGDGERYTTRITADDFALDLAFDATQPPLLNGEAGFSRKGPAASDASYYYSLPQLAVAGRLRLGGRWRQVRGRAWLDQEWSSSYLPEGARGWDWMGINLAGGGALMAYQMRGEDGKPLWAAASLRDGDGREQRFGPGEVEFEPLRSWPSPRSAARYPVAMVVRVGGRSFRLEPLMDDQEMDARRSTGGYYWEGAARLVEDTAQGPREAGRGYLELTGYAARQQM
jgi:predicted secreted hydrolase